MINPNKTLNDFCYCFSCYDISMSRFSSLFRCYLSSFQLSFIHCSSLGYLINTRMIGDYGVCVSITREGFVFLLLGFDKSRNKIQSLRFKAMRLKNLLIKYKKCFFVNINQRKKLEVMDKIKSHQTMKINK